MGSHSVILEAPTGIAVNTLYVKPSSPFINLPSEHYYPLHTPPPYKEAWPRLLYTVLNKDKDPFEVILYHIFVRKRGIAHTMFYYVPYALYHILGPLIVGDSHIPCTTIPGTLNHILDTILGAPDLWGLSYTMHYIPYTLDHILCTILGPLIFGDSHVPCTIYHTPYKLYHILYTTYYITILGPCFW